MRIDEFWMIQSSGGNSSIFTLFAVIHVKQNMAVLGRTLAAPGWVLKYWVDAKLLSL